MLDEKSKTILRDNPGVEPPLIARVYHPFGKGLITTTGAQYTLPAPAGIGNSYLEVERAIIPIPPNYDLIELEISIMGRTKQSGATDAVNYKVQGSDEGTSWDDLSAEQTRAADASTAADWTNALTGVINLAGGKALRGEKKYIYIRVVVKSAGTTDTVTAEVKNSSYISCIYQKSGR